MIAFAILPKSLFHSFSQLKVEVRQAEAASTGLQAQMKEMGHKVSDLEQRLKDHGAKCRELASLRTRVEELQSLTQSKEQSLAQSQREAQQNQAELASLEAILALLHLREVEKAFLSNSQFFSLLPSLFFHYTYHRQYAFITTRMSVHIYFAWTFWKTCYNCFVVTLNIRVLLVPSASGPACYLLWTIQELHSYWSWSQVCSHTMTLFNAFNLTWPWFTFATHLLMFFPKMKQPMRQNNSIFGNFAQRQVPSMISRRVALFLGLCLAGEGYQHLLRVMQSMEADRSKQSSLVERLQERLSRAQSEITSLQSSMAQRASHYQSLQTELLDKVNQATDTEKEVIPAVLQKNRMCKII